MRKIHGILTWTLLACISCSEEPKDPAETDNGEDGGSDLQEETADNVDCPDQWEQDGEIWIDPILCAAWSPLSEDRLTWHETVSAQEAELGGCINSCDAETETNHCADLELGGLDTWRVPTIDELGELSRRDAPFEELIGYLWTIDSDLVDDLAWTVDLSEAGMEVVQAKTNPNFVRCVAD